MMREEEAENVRQGQLLQGSCCSYWQIVNTLQNCVRPRNCWSWWHCLLSEILDRIYEIIQINNHSNILVTLKERESSWRICHRFVIFKHCNNQMFKIVMHQRFSNHQFNSSKLELISHIYQRLLPIFHIIEASFCFHLKDIIIIHGCKLKFTSWGPE